MDISSHLMGHPRLYYWKRRRQTRQAVRHSRCCVVLMRPPRPSTSQRDRQHRPRCRVHLERLGRPRPFPPFHREGPGRGRRRLTNGEKKGMVHLSGVDDCRLTVKADPPSFPDFPWQSLGTQARVGRRREDDGGVSGPGSRAIGCTGTGQTWRRQARQSATRSGRSEERAQARKASQDRRGEQDRGGGCKERSNNVVSRVNWDINWGESKEGEKLTFQ